MFARHATGFVSGAGSPKSPEARCGGVRGAITKPPSLSRRRRRICARTWRRSRFRWIQNAPAGFAGLQFEIFRLVDFLIDVWKQSHSAAAALFVYGCSESDTVVAFRGARIHVEDFFRNLRGDFFAQ